LTESSLFAETFSDEPTPSQTLTDPDQPTSSVDVINQPEETPEPAPLPAGYPSRIFPAVRIQDADELQDMTLTSIKFDLGLNWRWVVTNQTSSSQIFGYMPEVISTALGISRKSIALVIYEGFD
jgi:hypothetical protein